MNELAMSFTRKRGLAALLTIVLVAAGWLALSQLRHGPPSLRASVSAVAAASPDSAGFTRAEPGRALTFPADFGPHNDYQTEWWYYTGNLSTAEGEHFGYQLTFFRRALVPPAGQVQRASDWASIQVYMAHLALTDVAGKQHYAYQRLARGAAGLAGAAAQPYRVWLDDWSAADSAGAVHLSAAQEGIALQFELRDLKDPVLQGDQGYSRKGPEPGNASHYYSLTRIDTRGAITVSGRTYTVSGLSWMDHEFSTSALSPGQVGWDWFSLQLSDGRELMLFQIRDAAGRADPYSAGAIIDAAGQTQTLNREAFRLQPAGAWRSPHTGGAYPSGWRISIPGAGIDLTVTPYLPDQEMNVGYSYWEGAVRTEGQAGGQAISGSGYVELTGYAGSMAGQF